jgi:hypothetical protein
MWAVGVPLVQGCDSADVDATTGVCAHPYWVQQQSLIPQLDAAGGVAIAVAILTCWATAYVWKSFRRVGE